MQGNVIFLVRQRLGITKGLNDETKNDKISPDAVLGIQLGSIQHFISRNCYQVEMF